MLTNLIIKATKGEKSRKKLKNFQKRGLGLTKIPN